MGDGNKITVASGADTKVFKLGTEPPGWTDIDFDDSSWNNATAYPNPDGAWAKIENAQWIWHETMKANETCLFRHTFDLSGVPGTATIAHNHDNDLDGLYVNGTFIVSRIYGTDYAPYWTNVFTEDVSGKLKAGKNVVAARVRNYGGPAMWQFRLDLVLAGLCMWPKVNGEWKQTAPYVKVDGKWRPVEAGWIKDNGVWKSIIS